MITKNNPEIDLSDKAISIKGKDYVLVSDRIKAFNENYPNGSIKTTMLSEPADTMVVIQATVTPDHKNPDRQFTGYSQAKWGEGAVNRTSALENAETSAVGRALGMMGIGVLDSVASADEMVKAQATEVKPKIEAEAEMMYQGVLYRKARGEKNGKKWVGWFPPKDSGFKPVWGEDLPIDSDSSFEGEY